jgi:hypothetical protein
MGIPVEMVLGSAINFKVTVPEDFDLCRALLGKVFARFVGRTLDEVNTAPKMGQRQKELP